MESRDIIRLHLVTASHQLKGRSQLHLFHGTDSEDSFVGMCNIVLFDAKAQRSPVGSDKFSQ